jgi:anti-anti-sigma regulatory factor
VKIEKISAGTPTTFRLTGDLAFPYIRDVHEEILAAISGDGEKHVTVDLTGVEGIDLTTLQWIAACRSRVSFEGDNVLTRLAKMARFAGIEFAEVLQDHG